jgi:hypothetical protein
MLRRPSALRADQCKQTALFLNSLLHKTLHPHILLVETDLSVRSRASTAPKRGLRIQAETVYAWTVGCIARFCEAERRPDILLHGLYVVGEARLHQW